MSEQKQWTVGYSDRLEKLLNAASRRESVLLEALAPFAEFLTWIEAGRELDGDEPLSDHAVVAQYMGNGGSIRIHVSDLRAARAALTATQEPTS